MITLNINGRTVYINDEPDTPLLWVLRYVIRKLCHRSSSWRAQPINWRSTLLLALAWVMALDATAYGADNGAASTRAKPPTELLNQGANTMRIRLTIDGKAMTATLIDNATAKDFLSLLPMTLTLDDYAATEKISYLPRKLSTAGAPAGSDPSVGDITYYAPWGNLAIFYNDAGYARGLIQLGRIDSGIEALNVPGRLKVTIESSEK